MLIFVKNKSMTDTIVVSKTEYQKLQKQAKAFQKFAGKLFETVLTDSIETVVYDFRKTNLYTEAFLSDLESGLRKSSYAKR
jgi:hypothetical protein